MKKAVFKIVAVVLAVVAVAYVAVSLVVGTWNPKEFISVHKQLQNGGNQNGGNQSSNIPTIDTTGNGGTGVTEGENNGISLFSAQLPRAAFAANGIDESADSAYTIVATVSPDYASDKSLDGSVSWLNAESEFAAGKDVTDYMTVTQISEGTFNLICLQDFGEPVLLTVASRSNPEIFGICTIDYYQRVKSVDFAFTLDGEAVTPNVENGVYKVDYTGAEKDYVAEVVPVYSNYTIADETIKTSINGALTSDFGYTATASLNTVKIPAGISGGEPASSTINTIWNGLERFADILENPPESNEFPDLPKTAIYDDYINKAVSDEEKQYPRYLHIKELLSRFKTEYRNFFGTGKYFVSSHPTAEEIRTCLNSYVVPPYNFYGATVSAYNDFVVAVNRCNANGAGVLKYTVKISGERTTCEAVLQLGYNGELKVNVQDVTLSDSNIKI